MKKQLDNQYTFDSIKDIITHLTIKQMISRNNIWIARDYSLGALINDLRKINENN